MGELIDMVWNLKRCESIIHDHDCDLRVTMVGLMDLQDSDGMTKNIGMMSTHLVDSVPIL